MRLVSLVPAQAQVQGVLFTLLVRFACSSLIRNRVGPNPSVRKSVERHPKSWSVASTSTVANCSELDTSKVQFPTYLARRAGAIIAAEGGLADTIHYAPRTTAVYYMGKGTKAQACKLAETLS